MLRKRKDKLSRFVTVAQAVFKFDHNPRLILLVWTVHNSTMSSCKRRTTWTQWRTSTSLILRRLQSKDSVMTHHSAWSQKELRRYKSKTICSSCSLKSRSTLSKCYLRSLAHHRENSSRHFLLMLKENHQEPKLINLKAIHLTTRSCTNCHQRYTFRNCNRY